MLRCWAVLLSAALLAAGPPCLLGLQQPARTPRVFSFQGNDILVSGLTSISNVIFSPPAVNDAIAESTSNQKSFVSVQQLREGLRRDFELGYLFSGLIDETLYDNNCKFTDPTLTFEGLATFVRNIKAIRPLIDRFVGSNLVTLYSLEYLKDKTAIQAKWRMEGCLRLPWRPVIDVQGVTEYTFSASTGRIVDYFEQWTEQPQVALLKLLVPNAKNQERIVGKCSANSNRPAVLIPDTLRTATTSSKQSSPSLVESLAALEMHDTDQARLSSPLTRRYADSKWRLAFTTSRGASSGKIGPLSGLVTQQFLPPPSQAQEELPFVNSVNFAGGVLEVSLSATARANPTSKKRIDLTFIETIVKVLGVQVSRTSSPGKGYWRVIYETETVRVFETNAGSIFVLERV